MRCTAFARVLRFDPSHVGALFHDGVILAEQRRYRDAIERWQRVIELDSDERLRAARAPRDCARRPISRRCSASRAEARLAMAIEGPLRELGIHDVFQLLDLSRKTGVLRVTSELRDDEGVVTFDNGRVVHATIASKATPIGDRAACRPGASPKRISRRRARARRTAARRATSSTLLVEIGAITQKELERQLRLQIESVVFELMSWREGFFSFEERPRDDIRIDVADPVSTESLLMEGARRIDEWSRIADVIPNLEVDPELAPVERSRARAEARCSTCCRTSGRC